MLSKRQVQPPGQGVHGVGERGIQIQLGFAHDLFHQRAQLDADLIFDAVPEGNRAVGAPGGNELEHHGAQGMIGRKKLV